jgi:hypothetical protein
MTNSVLTAIQLGQVMGKVVSGWYQAEKTAYERSWNALVEGGS